jgi:hypothetical protein
MAHTGAGAELDGALGTIDVPVLSLTWSWCAAGALRLCQARLRVASRR